MPENAVDREKGSIPPTDDLAAFLGASVGFPLLYPRWLSLRGPISVAAVILGVVLGLTLDWPAAFAVSALGFVLAVDVLLRWRGAERSVAASVVFDTTLMGMTILVLQAPTAVIAIPFTYLFATTFLLLRLRRAALPAAYVVAWMLFLLVGDHYWWEAATGMRAAAASLILGGMFLGSLVVMFGFTSLALDGIRASLDRKVRAEEAIAGASRAFATGDDSTALSRALHALLHGTEAVAVFVERNVDDPVLGLCTSLIAEVLSDGTEPDPVEKWEKVPWSEMPFSYSGLSRGETVMFDISDLPDLERVRYEGSEVRSELDIPIMVRGEWVGLIGFNDIDTGRKWAERDIGLLATAAELVAAHWERIEAKQNLEEALTGLERRYRLEHALASVSSILLSSEDAGLDEALKALLGATEADFVFVDENYRDEQGRLHTRITHYAEDRDAQPADPNEEWWGGSYDEIPTVYEKLSRGRPSVILTSQLEGAEREIYEDDGLLSELCLPIFVRGEFFGSIAFSDYRIARQWTNEDVRFLRTAADMVGAFWERRGAVESLNVRVAFEEALSKVSAALMTETEESLPRALQILLWVTGADYLWVEENYYDDDGIFCAKVNQKAKSNALAPVAHGDPWVEGPWEETPTSLKNLSAGLPSLIRTSDLEGAERQLYVADGIRTELKLPIYVFGEWFGSLGLADYLKERVWQDQDVRVMRTAVGLIGSYLERKFSRERLEELVQSKDEFVASISHEVRTPLTSVLGFASLLRDGYGEMADSERRDMLNLINREAQEVAWIIDDLLVYARSDIGTLAVSAVETPLDAQIESVLAGQPDEHVAGIRAAVDDVAAIADPGRVRQILRNLITNAVKYGGSNVEIESLATDGWAALRVIDDGDGIKDELRDRVFEAYFRAHDSGGQPGSMGLGLNVSLKLARLMGGDLRYDRINGKTAFTLSLPLAEQAVGASA